MNDKKTEALKLALSVLDEVRSETFRLLRNGQKLYAEEKVWNAIFVIKQALAEQPAQQEPSMAYKVKMCPRQECASAAKCMSVACSSRAYIKPEQPAQPSKPLTDDRIWRLKTQFEKDAEMKIPEKPFRHVVRAIEAAHGIKEDA